MMSPSLCDRAAPLALTVPAFAQQASLSSSTDHGGGKRRVRLGRTYAGRGLFNEMRAERLH